MYLVPRRDGSLETKQDSAEQVAIQTRHQFRFTIRELCLLVTVLALMLGWAVDHYRVSKRMHDAAVHPFEDDLVSALSNAASIEIGECGPAMLVRSTTIEGQTLKEFARAAVVVDIEDFSAPISSNMFIEMRIKNNDDKVIATYTYWFPDGLSMERNNRRHMLRMSDSFRQVMQHNVLK